MIYCVSIQSLQELYAVMLFPIFQRRKRRHREVRESVWVRPLRGAEVGSDPRQPGPQPMPPGFPHQVFCPAPPHDDCACHQPGHRMRFKFKSTSSKFPVSPSSVSYLSCQQPWKASRRHTISALHTGASEAEPTEWLANPTEEARQLIHCFKYQHGSLSIWVF